MINSSIGILSPMKNIIILASVCLLLFVGTINQAAGHRELVLGSGRLVTENPHFTDFVNIEAHSSFQVRITQSPLYSVSITADHNVMDHVRVRKVGRTLELTIDPDYRFQRITLRAAIRTPDLRSIRLSGASELVLEDFSLAHDLDLHLSGASEAKGDLSARDLALNLSGASKIRLRGTGRDLTVEGSGASDLDLSDFAVRNVSVMLSGATEASVNMNGELRCDMSGASRLYYRGKANVDLEYLSLSGAAKIEKR